METLQKMLRKPLVLQVTGRGHASHYNDIANGLMTEPVHIGSQSVAWPENEIAAINRARIAGKTNDEIRALVTALHAQRKVAAWQRQRSKHFGKAEAVNQTEREGNCCKPSCDDRPYVVQSGEQDRQCDQRLDHARRNAN